MTSEDKLQAVMSWIDDSLKPIEHAVELSRYRMLKLFEVSQAFQDRQKTTILANNNNDFLIFCDYNEVSILDRKRGKYGKARRRKTDNFNLFFGLAIAWARLNGRKLPEFACGFEPQQYTAYQTNQKRFNEEKFYTGLFSTDLLITCRSYKECISALKHANDANIKLLKLQIDDIYYHTVYESGKFIVDLPVFNIPFKYSNSSVTREFALQWRLFPLSTTIPWTHIPK